MTAAQEVKVSEKEITKTKWASRVGYFVLALALITLGVVAYWANQSSNVLEIKNDPIPIKFIHSADHPQGIVILKYSFCKNTDAVGIVQTSFVGVGTKILVPEAEDRSLKSCNANLEVPYLIPPQVVPGKYRLNFEARYKINPIKTTVTKWQSQEFEVAE